MGARRAVLRERVAHDGARARGVVARAAAARARRLHAAPPAARRRPLAPSPRTLLLTPDTLMEPDDDGKFLTTYIYLDLQMILDYGVAPRKRNVGNITFNFRPVVNTCFFAVKNNVMLVIFLHCV